MLRTTSWKRILVLALALSGLFLTARISAAGGGPVGAVYAMTNAEDANEVVVYDRFADGTLRLAGRFATGGRGVGDTTEPVDALGSQGPLLLTPDRRWLIAVNAGSDEISVFRVRPSRLVLVDKVPSGGLFPASLTLNGNLLYVLNSGGDGNITGFVLGILGRLHPLPGSTRSLEAGGTNPPFFLVSPAQVSFSPDGDALVVTVKGSDEILVFGVGADGRPAPAPVVNASNGSTPFGFDFDRDGRLLVAEPFGSGGVGDPGASAVSSYRLRSDGTLELIDGSVDNFQTASCWLRVAGGRFAYVTNNASATISGYRVRANGTLQLLGSGGVAATTGPAPVDLAITPDGGFLYNVNAGEAPDGGTVGMYRIRANGTLEPLGLIGGLPAEAGAVGIAAW